MPRLVFPDDPLVYQLDSNAVFKGQAGLQVTVYLDSAASVLADIQTMANAPVAGSILFVDPSSQMPLFRGPEDGTDTLYIKPAVEGAVAQAVYARADDRIDALGTSVVGQNASIDAANKTAKSYVRSLLFGVPL